MILYRKGTPLKIRRWTAPEPPFWCASSVAPYSGRRATPIAIDYGALRASAGEKAEAGVCENVRDELERARTLAGPVFVDAAEGAEAVFRRGQEVLAFCEENRLGALELVSARGAFPARAFEDAVIAVAAWPFELRRLEELFAEAETSGMRWGVAVPLLYPMTTDRIALESLADGARKHGAAFLASISLEVEATAKQSMAQSLGLDGEDDRYAMLFHGDVAPLHLATERHLAALAAERGLADFITPPEWNERTNWNAAIALTRTASRMIALDLDLDLAGRMARSARVVAEMARPIVHVAEAASLSIVEALDETSVEMLTQWVAGEPMTFTDFVDEQWRLRR